MNEEELLEIWEKATKVDGYDPDVYRKDDGNAWIGYSKYGDRKDDFGWEVDHIVPKSKLEKAGASPEEIDNLLNLRPYNWRNNDAKSDDYPKFQRAVTSNGKSNEANHDWRSISKELQKELHKLYGKYGF